MNQNRLSIKWLDRQYSEQWTKNPPLTQPKSWVKKILAALNMSNRQFAERLGMTASSAGEIAQREIEGTITLNTLRKAADALDMELFYLFIPKTKSLNPADRTLNHFIEERAHKVARQLVMASSTTMNLENQGTGSAALEEGIEDLAIKLKQEMPRTLWN